MGSNQNNHKSNNSGNNNDKIITLADLQKDFERERRNKGETVLKPKNGGETYALKDKSYRSSPDFFKQLFRKMKDEKDENSSEG